MLQVLEATRQQRRPGERAHTELRQGTVTGARCLTAYSACVKHKFWPGKAQRPRQQSGATLPLDLLAFWRQKCSLVCLLLLLRSDSSISLSPSASFASPALCSRPAGFLLWEWRGLRALHDSPVPCAPRACLCSRPTYLYICTHSSACGWCLICWDVIGHGWSWMVRCV